MHTCMYTHTQTHTHTHTPWFPLKFLTSLLALLPNQFSLPLYLSFPALMCPLHVARTLCHPAQEHKITGKNAHTGMHTCMYTNTKLLNHRRKRTHMHANIHICASCSLSCSTVSFSSKPVIFAIILSLSCSKVSFLRCKESLSSYI